MSLYLKGKEIEIEDKINLEINKSQRLEVGQGNYSGVVVIDSTLKDITGHVYFGIYKKKNLVYKKEFSNSCFDLQKNCVLCYEKVDYLCSEIELKKTGITKLRIENLENPLNFISHFLQMLLGFYNPSGKIKVTLENPV